MSGGTPGVQLLTFLGTVVLLIRKPGPRRAWSRPPSSSMYLKAPPQLFCDPAAIHCEIIKICAVLR